MPDRELILLVEDDLAVASSVKRRLVFEGYRVETAHDGQQACVHFEALQPDLVILDVGLPGMSGLKVAEWIRERSQVPVLMLTARDRVEDRVEGLQSGADDYLIKPFAIEELQARMRALLRRANWSPQPDSDSILRFENLTLNQTTMEVSRGDQPISLTPREYQLLEHFMRHPRQVLSREALFGAVWGLDHMGESNIVDVNVKKIREKTELNGLPRLIHTVRGFGYALRETS